MFHSWKHLVLKMMFQISPILSGFMEEKIGAPNGEKISGREVVYVFCLGVSWKESSHVFVPRNTNPSPTWMESGHLWTSESEMVGLPTPHPSRRDEVTMNITPPPYRGSLTPPPWEKILRSGFCDSQVLPQQPVRVSSTERSVRCSMVMFWWYLCRLIMFLVVKMIFDQYGS